MLRSIAKQNDIIGRINIEVIVYNKKKLKTDIKI